MIPGQLGATYTGSGRCRFEVWAPAHERVDLHLLAPEDRVVPMELAPRGYHTVVADHVEPGALYRYRFANGIERPDPASRYQPEGVHGPSQVVNPVFQWRNPDWQGRRLQEFVLYELHVGTYTPEGTFDAVIPFLDELRDLGITAVEIMPVAQFPGNRNWGYDGVYPFAVQNSYGGPAGLKRLIDACHERGMAAILDVVYNHLGPEGNYLRDFGPYFTARHQTPWGAGLNFDGPESDEVRRFFIENALYWTDEFRLDGLRLDAVHAIYDFSAYHILAAMSDAVHQRAHELNRKTYLIPESDLNDSRLIRPREEGGYCMDAQWADDFHHALRAALTGERAGYYADFDRFEHLAIAFRQAYVYTGQYSRHRKRSHGNSPSGIPPFRFVVFSQNHDQIGNRVLGERLAAVVPMDSLKLAAAAVILTPFLPMIFMGEEYADTAPFLYFVSHSDPDLIEAVRVGRRSEFASFAWQVTPPDPQAEDTFRRSKLNHRLKSSGDHATLFAWYRELVRLRAADPAFAPSGEHAVVGDTDNQTILLLRWHANTTAALLYHFGDGQTVLNLPGGKWEKVLDSGHTRWGGRSQAPEVVTSGAVEMESKTFLCYRRSGA
jgi:maltooligosyltrehalose trehalohydrolase